MSGYIEKYVTNQITTFLEPKKIVQHNQKILLNIQNQTQDVAQKNTTETIFKIKVLNIYIKINFAGMSKWKS